MYYPTSKGVENRIASWKVIYDQRQSAEHLFSRLKEHRRLDDHCFRGIEKVTLNCPMAALIIQGSALAKLRARKRRELRVCVRRVTLIKGCKAHS